MKRFLITLLTSLTLCLTPAYTNAQNIEPVVTTDTIIEQTIQIQLVEYSKTFMGTPYVWGATGPKCFDCSGFVGYVYKHFGIILPRCSWQMATRGDKVSVEESQPGDLIFFKNPKKPHPVGHVGMVTKNNGDGTIEFIHCSCSKGVITQHFPDNGYYSKRFVQIRRMI